MKHLRQTFLIFALLGTILVLPTCGGTGVTKSVNDSAYFYRLQARYSHGDEPIDIDVVVGCSVRVTEYRGGDSGFLAAIFPRFYVQQTRDGHEVMQILPLICRGETTENGLIPADFLPGIIWFDKAGDRRFGIAHVSEDAFENPNGKLKFHGATVQKATLAEWEAFRKRAAGNEGFRERYYTPDLRAGDAARVRESRGADIEAASSILACRGVSRYELSEAARAELRKFWPANRPRYWASKGGNSEAFKALRHLESTTPIFVNGFRYEQHFTRAAYTYTGFPTRARRGVAYSKHPRLVPPEFFPMRRDLGIPWIFSERVALSPYVGADVEIASGPGKGFFYCYQTYSESTGLYEILPDLRKRTAQIRVDGQPVWTPEPKRWNVPPRTFFEHDRYVYQTNEWGAWP
jgi:hypothetical protein